jgi:hypothetical protein
LHGAKSDAPGEPIPVDPARRPGHQSGDSDERRVAEILDQLAARLRADAEMEADRLTLARNGGALVLELKRIVPFGGYMDTLKERFPRSSYHKLHRWRFLAERDAEVEAALRAHPDVAWGQTKMIAYLKGDWSPDAQGGRGEDGVGESTGPVSADQEGSGPALADDAEAGGGTDSDIGSQQQAVVRPQGGTNAPDKKYEKLMGRFDKGGDMHKGGKPKAKPAQPPGYRVTVVTPERGDLEKFGSLLPSPITDLNAHSVTAWVQLQDIASTTASVVSTLTTSNLKKVRIVVEL